MSLKSLLPWFFFALSCSNHAGLPTKANQLSVAILPLDYSKSQNLTILSKDISDFYHCKCTILPAKKLPKSAFYKTNNRYRADSILQYLNTLNTDTFDLYLAVTAKDISATVGSHKDWGVFGLGNCPGHVAVISDFRLHKNSNNTTINTRLKNVAIHEIGHNYGLPHCGDTMCIMKDAKGKLVSVEGLNRKFCTRCQNKIYE